MRFFFVPGYITVARASVISFGYNVMIIGFTLLVFPVSFLCFAKLQLFSDMTANWGEKRKYVPVYKLLEGKHKAIWIKNRTFAKRNQKP